jgi:hypothetical protein
MMLESSRHTTGGDMQTVYKGGRYGAKRHLRRLGMSPGLAKTAVDDARALGIYIHDMRVNGHIIGVGAAQEMAIFTMYRYIIVVD